jgi:hypothetical protein
VNTHPISFATYSRGLWERVLAEARRLAIPRMSLEGYAEFWEARQQVEVGPATPTETGRGRRAHADLEMRRPCQPVTWRAQRVRSDLTTFQSVARSPFSGGSASASSK